MPRPRRLSESCPQVGASAGSARAASITRRIGVVVVLVAGACSPRPPSGWSGPFDAPAVVARVVAAAGGPAALEPPSTSRALWRVVLHPPEGKPLAGDIVTWAEGAARERRELVTSDGHHLLRIVDGERFRELEDGVPTGRDPREELALRRRFQSILREFAGAGADGVELAPPRAGDPDGAIVLTRSFDDGERWELAVAPESLLVVAVRRFARESDDDHLLEERLDAHERFGSRVLARRHVTWRDGRLLKEAWLVEQEEGVALDAALFELDPAR